MRDPLNHRFKGELRSDLGKYLIIFLFFVLIIGATSGYIVACDSMMTAYDTGLEKYNVEDGNLDFVLEPDEDLIKDIEEEGDITLYNNWYKDEETEGFDSTLRIYGERNDIDKLCLMEGSFPEAMDEVAIDRLYAKNHELKIGSTITAAERTFTVSGIVAFTDYSCLFENPSDLMFDNDMFGVGTVTDETFADIRDNHIHYSYSWKYNKAPADDGEAKDMAEDLVEVIAEKAMLQNFIPAFSNQAIQFARNDMGGDRSSMIAFLYITVVILAFIFVVTTESTIVKESAVIGTLRASGYRKGELIRHYMTLPMVTLFVGAIVGNVLGYTWLEKYMALAYYNSYSLTKYEIEFNVDAFVLTTVVPFIIMAVINFIALARKLTLSPLKFLRRDLSRKQKKKAFRLNTKIPILTRFRLRILFQNISSYAVIVVGVFLGYSILFFGLMFGPMLDNYKDKVTENMLAKYIYVLRTPAETENEAAEKGALYTLQTTDEKVIHEDASIYGIVEGSRYVGFDHGRDGVIVSTAFKNKYELEVGDEITLKEKYSDKEYVMKVDGTFDYPSTIAVFMDIDRFNELFGFDEGYFNLYFSSSEIEDIDDRLVMTCITEEDLTKASRQLNRSMGSIMDVFKVFGVIMFIMVIYLLAKLIIEKNAQSISMTKILGYTNREINGLYVHTTTIVAILSMIVTLPLVDRLIGAIFTVIFKGYSGYFAYESDLMVMLKCMCIGIPCYLLVAFILDRKVKRVELAEALKNVE